MNKRLVAKELLKMAKELLAIDFPTKDAMDKYLKDHPDADRSNHHVVETKKEEPKKDAYESYKEKGKKEISEYRDKMGKSRKEAYLLKKDVTKFDDLDDKTGQKISRYTDLMGDTYGVEFDPIEYYWAKGDARNAHLMIRKTLDNMDKAEEVLKQDFPFDRLQNGKAGVMKHHAAVREILNRMDSLIG